MVKNLPANAGDNGYAVVGLIPQVKRSPGRGNGNSLQWVAWSILNCPVFLPGQSHGQRSLAGYSPWGPKESDTT